MREFNHNYMSEGKKVDILISKIIEGIESVKGKEVTLIDLSNLEQRVCDFFIICSGTSDTQVNAIHHSVEKHVRKTLKERPWHTAGEEYAHWILMDYVNVVVHIFQPEYRSFYNIEALWADGKVSQVNTENEMS